MNELVHVFLLTVTLLSFPTTKAAYISHTCVNDTVFTPNSTFQTNLNHLLSALSSNATRDTGFYNTTSGSTPNVVYGLFLCRGDVTASACRTCVTTATSDAVQRCPVEKDVVIWYDYCMLRYSYKSFFSVVDESEGLYTWTTDLVGSEADRFNEVLAANLAEVAKDAADDGDRFATRVGSFTAMFSIYSLAQCTPDLSSSDCNGCLVKAIAVLPGCCKGRIGAQIVQPSCNIRYDNFPFYTTEAATTSPPPKSSTLPPPPKSDKSQTRTVIIIVVSTVVSLTLIISLYVFVKVRNKRKENLQRLPGNLTGSNGRNMVQVHASSFSRRIIFEILFLSAASA